MYILNKAVCCSAGFTGLLLNSTLDEFEISKIFSRFIFDIFIRFEYLSFSKCQVEKNSKPKIILEL